MKKLLFWLILCFLNLNVIAQTSFFISNKGRDDNDGKTVSSSWKTLKEIRPGNSYYFKRGDTFNFTIDQVNNPNRLPIKISSYGKGNKPIISLYKRITGGA